MLEKTNLLKALQDTLNLIDAKINHVMIGCDDPSPYLRMTWQFQYIEGEDTIYQDRRAQIIFYDTVAWTIKV